MSTASMIQTAVAKAAISKIRTMRIAFVLPGLHRVNRGAETAFESVARELAKRDDCEVTLFGSGFERSSDPYAFVHVPCVPRQWFEKWPRTAAFRRETAYEEFTFAARLWRRYDPSAFDVVITCSYPYCNWLLRAKRHRGRRPIHLFVTQNGDWPAYASNGEYRFFGCDGLVCTNPEYYQRNRERWRSALIPNGVDAGRFHPGDGDRRRFGLPAGRPIVLMVSALIASKRVLEGIEVASRLNDVHLVVAGDGPLREQVEEAGRRNLPGRFTRISIPREQMPELYRSAEAFLHMSKDEPSANAYIEALASGLPIITHDRQVTRWTLEDCAILIDTENLSQVVQALDQALNHDDREGLRRRRKLVARRFTWQNLAGEYAIFIDQLRQGLPTPRPSHVRAPSYLR